MASPDLSSKALSAWLADQDSESCVLFLDVEDHGTIAEIARAIQDLAVALGHPRSDRTYRPHLTLALLKDPVDLRKLTVDLPIALEGRAVALSLYESALGPEGAIYTPIARFL